MPKISVIVLLCFFTKHTISQGLGSGTDGNLRVCIVEGKGSYRRASKFCPILDAENSGVECVLATDRLDCLRRMSKGTVDFGVFSPEDLIAAQWAQLDVLVTNELRHRPDDFERSVVGIVNVRVVPEGVTTLETMLRNTTLCHPGIGGEDSRGLSDTLSQYLESHVTARSCETDLSLSENRLKAMAGFFGRACKAGAWVPDARTDAELKSKYPSLCAACSSRRCDSADAYWGASGALNCLVDGAGDFTWVTLREANAYFSLVPAARDHFRLLCRDGSTRAALAPEPCVWLRRPWPAVVAKTKAAETVSKLATSLTNSSVTVDRHWRGALAALLEVNRALSEPLAPQKAPLDYLARAAGFREAYSQSGCSPPRQVQICTTSIIEQHKCDWLAEAGSVYGVDPSLQCVRRESRKKCFEAVEKGEVDVTVADADWLVRSKRDYSVSPILYEATPIVGNLNTVAAYVRKDSAITRMSDLRSRRAAFATFDGVAWHALTRSLIEGKQIEDCRVESVAAYFGDSCAPGVEGARNVSQATIDKLTRSCYRSGTGVNRGELFALQSLVERRTDVAFVSVQTFNLYNDKLILELWAKNSTEITQLCPEDNPKYCLLSWSTLGQVYAANDIKPMRRREIVTMFKKLDQLFGKNYPFHTAMFSMYGPFNHEIDVLFHNNTNLLATAEQLSVHPYKNIPSNFESSLVDYKFDSCFASAANAATPVILVMLASLVFSMLRS